MTATSTPGAVEKLVEVGVLHLLFEPAEEELLERFARNRGSPAELGVHIVGDVFDLGTGLVRSVRRLRVPIGLLPR